MDIKVIEQLVEQALKEIKAEQPLKFTNSWNSWKKW